MVFYVLQKLRYVTPVHESVMHGDGKRKIISSVFLCQLSRGNTGNGVSGSDRTGMFHFGKCEPRQCRIADDIRSPCVFGNGQTAPFFHSLYFFFRIPDKNVDVGMIFEKAESESTVFSSDGGRYMYGIVLYELPVFCSEPEGFRFIDAFQQEMYGREEEGTSVCFDMFVGLSKVYECGDSEKRIVESGKEFEMLPAVPMSDVDGLFHGLIY